MRHLQKAGGIAALYLAAAYITGIVLFLVVLDYPGIDDPAKKVALIVDKEPVFYITNLLLYVFFGVVLIVMALALYERLGTASPLVIRTALAVGIVWAALLIASGMVANEGVASVVALNQDDPAQATATWLSVEPVADALGGANGELLGGVFTLLVSWAALQVNGLPKGMNYLGVAVGVVGIVSTVPGLDALVGLFGISQVLWFVWLGVVLLEVYPRRHAVLQHPGPAR